MVSNLKSARHAIEAELSHARQGSAYYAARVEALEIALHQLDNVEAPVAAPAKRQKYKGKAGGQNATATRGRGLHRMARKKGASQASDANDAPAVRGKGGARKKARAAGVATANGAEGLPTTGAEFWLNLINDQPQSAVDISNAAIATLGIKPEQKREIQKIKQRVAPALASLVATQKIRDSGAGRERRFFKTA